MTGPSVIEGPVINPKRPYFFDHVSVVSYTFAFIILSLIPISVYAGQHNADLLSISKDAAWQRLLYYDLEKGRSDVISADYFLSPEGRSDPLKELKATLDSYSKPFPADADQHARCRFPARYLWLSERIHLANYQVIHPQCVSLKKSQEKLQLDSISLMFVTGYLGNPASSFGHSFIKLDTRNSYGDNSLFDLTISYGADVPENENVFLYIYRGLFGEYKAKISDKYFYSEDLVFSSTEFRDIWEYKLNLKDQQLLFFQLHMWEILGQQFQYYFLHRNCGYELSRILEVVIDGDLVKSADVYFLPIETFFSLSEIPPENTMFSDVIYHPSEQKVVYEHYQRLSDSEKQYVLEIMEQDKVNISILDTLEDGEQIEIIDFLLTYHKYLLTRDPDNEIFEKSKKALLVQRFNLPPRAAPEIEIEQFTPPVDSDKPGMFFAGYNYLDNQDDFFTFGYSPYAAQSLGRNNMNGNELIIMNAEIGVSEKAIFLDRFDLIRIKSFDRYHLPLENTLPLSWQLEAAVENINYENYDEFLGYFRGGIGKTWLQNRSVLGYVMVNGGLYTKGDNVLVTPEVGIRVDLGFARGLINIHKAYNLDGESDFLESKLIALAPISKDISFSIEMNYRDEFRANAGLQFYMY